MPRSEREVAVVGAGPAGIAAAQQLVREGIDEIVVFEKERVGGLIYQAYKIENFPGFVGREGRYMVEEFEKIVSKYGITVRREGVRSIESIQNSFSLNLDDDIEKASILILATGTKPIKMGFEGENTHPDWRDHSGEKIIIIGGGDAAYDYALRVKRLGGEVMIMRRSAPKALPVLVKRAEEKGVEEINTEPEMIQKCDEEFYIQTEEDEFRADEVITAIGREPRFPELSYDFQPQEVDFPTGETEKEGLFVIGSTVLGTYRQASLSWGMGIAAGMKAAGKIRHNRKY